MGARRCCCTCAWLFDQFDRVGETDDDGVNVPGGMVYTFEEGHDEEHHWDVVTATGGWAAGGVLQSHGLGKITFLAKPASVEVTVGNFGIGSTAKLSSGDHYVEITGVDDGLGHVVVHYDFDGDVFEEPWGGITGATRSVYLPLKFAKPDGHDELLHNYYPPAEDGMMRGPQCRDVAIDVSEEEFEWTLEATDGVEFNELYAVKLQPDCTTFEQNCHHTCLENNPDTAEITVGGMEDTMGHCEDGSRTECLTDSSNEDADCVAAAVGCSARCACATDKKARDCACNNSNTIQVRECPAIANGTYVVNRLGDVRKKCAGPCLYRGVVPLEPLWDGLADVPGACQNNVPIETEIAGELLTVYYDAESQRRIVKFEVLMPLVKSDDTGVTWSTENVPAESFCDGESLSVTPSEPIYADECKLSFRAASAAEGDPLISNCEHSAGPVGPMCGDDTQCIETPEDPETPCGDTPEINPTMTRPSHTAITVDNLEAV